MKKIAIVGNIASGKSQVENILTKLGYKVADTDKINHCILENDTETINEILKTFPFDNIIEDGKISREKLGKIVFSNKEKLQKLESILHKKIFQKLDEFYKINKNEKFVFVAIPLLFEIKKENLFDKIIFISANKEIRKQRLIQRNNYTEEYAITRINAQKNEEEKIKKADFIIYNNSTIDELKKQIQQTLTLL